jgi:hypothetical protein
MRYRNLRSSDGRDLRYTGRFSQGFDKFCQTSTFCNGVKDRTAFTCGFSSTILTLRRRGISAIKRLAIRIDNPAAAAAEIETVITEPTSMILDTVADDPEQFVDELLTEEPPELPVKPSPEPLPGIPAYKLVSATMKDA